MANDNNNNNNDPKNEFQGAFQAPQLVQPVLPLAPAPVPLESLKKYSERLVAEDAPNYERTILIIGISSFLGPYLARAFQSRGYNVLGSYNRTPISLPGVETFSMNSLANGEVLDTLYKYRPYTTIYCAGLTDIAACEKNPELANNLNDSALTFFNQSQAIHRPLVYFSCDEIFDGKSGPYHEKSLPGPLHKLAQSKLSAEIFMRKQYTAGYLNIRLPRSFGVSHKLSFEKKLIIALKAKTKIFVPGNLIRSFSYAPDTAKAVVSIFEKGAINTTYNLGAKNSVSLYDFSVLIANKMGLDSSLIHPFELKDKHRAHDCTMDTTKLTTETGHQPLTVEQGVELWVHDMKFGRISVL